MRKKLRIAIIISFTIGMLCFIIGDYFFTKFKNAEVELGSEVTNKDFVRYGTTNNINVDLSNVGTDVGEYDVRLKYLFVNYNLKVIILVMKIFLI